MAKRVDDLAFLMSVGSKTNVHGPASYMMNTGLYRSTDGDEKWQNIGLKESRSIARIVVELNHKTGLTVVLVEQNIDMIRAMAQRCYVMDKGRVVAELTPAMLDDSEVVRRYLAV